MGNNIFKYLTWLLCKHFFTLSHLQTINFVFSHPVSNFFFNISQTPPPPHPLEWVKDLFYDNWESHCWQRRAWVCDVLLRDYHNNVREVTKQNRLLIESLLQAIQVWNYPNSPEHWALKSCSVIKLWNVELLAPWLLPWHVVSRSLQRKRAWAGWVGQHCSQASQGGRELIVTHSLTCQVSLYPNFKCHTFRVGVTKGRKQTRLSKRPNQFLLCSFLEC